MLVKREYVDNIQNFICTSLEMSVHFQNNTHCPTSVPELFYPYRRCNRLYLLVLLLMVLQIIILIIFVGNTNSYFSESY